MPNKRKYTYSGKLERFPSTKVYLNIQYLEQGDYELYIMHNNRLVKKTTFKK